MRKNIFLHFMNRDSREIFGLFEGLDLQSHYLATNRALNAAILLCEDFCVMPPGFAVEDDVAFELLSNARHFLTERLLRFPMRENSLADFAEKKRAEYSPMRHRYQGLFDDQRLEFLSQNALGLMNRKSKIGEMIVSGWSSAADENSGGWQRVKKLITPGDIDLIRNIPSNLADDGTAVTWSAIAPMLPGSALSAKAELRDSLQHIYFLQYCSEFRLVVLSELDFMKPTFGLNSARWCNYHWFSEFLRAFGLRDILIKGSAVTVARFKRERTFTDFIDVFSQLATSTKTLLSLQYIAQVSESASNFDFAGFARRNNPLIGDPSEIEIREIVDAIGEVATHLATQNNLVLRSARVSTVEGRMPGRKPSKTTAKQVNQLESASMASLVLYVALQEELDVLVDILGLSRPVSGPAATGTIGDVQIDVLCPRAMGRVMAAVEVTKYLTQRSANLPKLMLVVGLAGGFDSEGSKPGHTINATTVVDLAQRKVTDAEDDKGPRSKLRRRDFNLDQKLYGILNSDAFDKPAWINEAIAVAEWPDDERPTLRSGAIASGEEVVGSSEWQKKLIDHGGKLLGVEMEAGGVCQAAETFKVPVSMLRVVSDKADPSKADDAWRKRGMRTLALLLKVVPFKQVLDQV